MPMMDTNTIFCSCDLFTYNQKIVIYKDGKIVDNINTTIDNLAGTILGLCYQEGIYSVTLNGHNQALIPLEESLYTLNRSSLYNAKHDIKITKFFV